MSAYTSRGAGVLIRLRVEHRLNLDDLALVLFSALDDTEDDVKDLSVADTRQAIADRLSMEGRDAVINARDLLSSDEEEYAERLDRARRMVAKAYRRNFEKYAEALAAFEAR
jgi:hypothetical protein